MTDRPLHCVAKTTPDRTQQQIERLKHVFTECVAEGQHPTYAIALDLLDRTSSSPSGEPDRVVSADEILPPGPPALNKSAGLLLVQTTMIAH